LLAYAKLQPIKMSRVEAKVKPPPPSQLADEGYKMINVIKAFTALELNQRFY
jgi:hypothetical protein